MIGAVLPRGIAVRLVVGIVLALAGCFSSYHPPDWTRIPRSSGLAPTARLAGLTSDQLRALCEWKATVLGGFDRQYRCDPAHFFATYTRDACGAVKAPPADRCAATVADDERCIVRVSSNPCFGEDWASLPECTAVMRDCWRKR
jgi:hypothetical protein